MKLTKNYLATLKNIWGHSDYGRRATTTINELVDAIAEEKGWDLTEVQFCFIDNTPVPVDDLQEKIQNLWARPNDYNFLNCIVRFPNGEEKKFLDFVTQPESEFKSGDLVCLVEAFGKEKQRRKCFYTFEYVDSEGMGWISDARSRKRVELYLLNEVERDTEDKINELKVEATGLIKKIKDFRNDVIVIEPWVRRLDEINSELDILGDRGRRCSFNLGIVSTYNSDVNEY